MPDWICEVLSPATEKRDRSAKLAIYARGEFYDPETMTRSPMPEVRRDWGVIINLPPGSEYRIHVIVKATELGRGGFQLAARFAQAHGETLFKDRTAVDHFSGVVPEAKIREMLDKHLPFVERAEDLTEEERAKQREFFAKLSDEIAGPAAPSPAPATAHERRCNEQRQPQACCDSQPVSPHAFSVMSGHPNVPRV